VVAAAAGEAKPPPSLPVEELAARLRVAAGGSLGSPAAGASLGDAADALTAKAVAGQLTAHALDTFALAAFAGLAPALDEAPADLKGVAARAALLQFIQRCNDSLILGAARSR
jgi:hypothetical protein